MHHNLTAIENAKNVIHNLNSMSNTMKSVLHSLQEDDREMADFYAEIFASEFQAFCKPHVDVAENERIEEVEGWFKEHAGCVDSL